MMYKDVIKFSEEPVIRCSPLSEPEISEDGNFFIKLMSVKQNFSFLAK